MTTGGAIKPEYGTRFEFALADPHSEGASNVLYNVTIFRGDLQYKFVLALSDGAVAVNTDCEGIEPDARAQMLALAKVIAKRKEDELWPRRILRWRQPGVR